MDSATFLLYRHHSCVLALANSWWGVMIRPLDSIHLYARRRLRRKSWASPVEEGSRLGRDSWS